jgi:hypothetical protein
MMKQRFLECMRLQYPLGVSDVEHRGLIRLWCVAWCECARALGKRLPAGEVAWVESVCCNELWHPDQSWKWWNVPFSIETTVDLRRGDPLIGKVRDLKSRGLID